MLELISVFASVLPFSDTIGNNTIEQTFILLFIFLLLFPLVSHVGTPFFSGDNELY